jgi:hypothetical protein
MIKTNLIEYFDKVNISKEILELSPKILAIQIIALYFQIKNWYVNNITDDNILLYRSLIENKDILKDIHNIGELYSNISVYYYSLLCVVHFCPLLNTDIKIKEYIKRKYKKGCIYSIFISSTDTDYIIFVFHIANIVIIINVNNLEITEFKSLDDAIFHIDKIIPSYYYQIIRLVQRCSVNEYMRRTGLFSTF